MRNNFKHVGILGLTIAILSSSLTGTACTVTSDEIARNNSGEQRLHISGNLDNKYPDVPVNLWLYKDDTLVRLEQTTTNSDGVYNFEVNMSKFANGGKFRYKIAARTETPAEKVFEFYSDNELMSLYKTSLFDEVDISVGVTEQNIKNICSAVVQNKSIMEFTDSRYGELLSDDAASMVTAGFIADEILLMKQNNNSYDTNSMIDTLKRVAIIKHIEKNDSTDEIVDLFLSKDESDRLNKLEKIGLSDNKVIALFDTNATDDSKSETSRQNELTEQEYGRKVSRYTSFAQKLISADKYFKNRNDFEKCVNSALIIADISRCRGTEKMSELLSQYSEKTGIVNLDKFNNSNNDKDAVLKDILLKLENDELKEINQLQTVLDKNIAKQSNSESGNSGSSGRGGSSSGYYPGSGSDVYVPGNTFNENDLVESDVAQFKDMSGYEWAKESVDALSELNMINGYSNDRFAPGEMVTREQFAKMMCSLFDIAPTGGNTDFADVESGSWYCGYVAALHGAGYINGVDGSCFGTGRYISRQDAFSIIYRIMKDKGYVKGDTSSADFFDWNDVAEYARVPIGTLFEMGLITGSNSNVMPANNMTRAEGAVMMYRLYKEML